MAEMVKNEKKTSPGAAPRLTQFSPVCQSIARPLWSVMIPTYHCAAFLRETLESVLQQASGPDVMQIEVIDDCSRRDHPEKVVEEVGKGRVQFFRQPANAGHTRNFDTCIERSRGHLVHILHGDDRVQKGFYSKMGALFSQYPQIGAGFCRNHLIDEPGNYLDVSNLEEPVSGMLSDSLQRMAKYQIVQPPAMVVRRSVYETVGGYDHRLAYAEDWEMWVRIAAHYPIGYEPEPLADYRKNNNSITSQLVKSGEDIKSTLKAIKIMQEYLNEPDKKTVEKYSRRAFSENHRSVSFAYFYSQRDPIGTRKRIAALLQLNHQPRFILSLVRLYLNTFLISR